MHHLCNVLRKKKGDFVRLFNEDIGEWLGEIEHIKRDQCQIKILKQIREPHAQSPLILAFSLLKGDATKRIIRMGTELCVTKFIPIMTQRTNTHRINKKRLLAIATEAAQQCERLDQAEITDPYTLREFLDLWPEHATLYVAMERQNHIGLFPSSREGTGHAILTGPEGGFTQAECRYLLDKKQIYPFSLGEEILRADTAAIASLTLLKNQLHIHHSSLTA